jgi:hypothetical protein
MSTRHAIAVRHPLIDQLATRLRQGETLEEPYVLQDRVGQTRTRHAVVIWNAWLNEDRQTRSHIIVEAFSLAGKIAADTLTVALGLSQREAMEYGYLRFQVQGLWKKEDGAALRAQIRRAVDATPGVHIRTGTSVELRYPTLDLAQEAYRQLSERIPGPYWVIAVEQPSSQSG